ncbi:serine/threonine-protein kinase [Streptomyces sp. NBC_01142]|uniref:protein kinase domain-containing protein n=1 Tax=Streptomyces sp. NBC_01142 TaxID=2975865 RepID=UPI0022530200|nr:PQQ-binding-like beta-propeller repeat protein [Streptomyces sp. NBC_01142]MCX4823442.1 serine/threonine-protein kinase [Streptomyces sp. NBC_01142]
MNPLGPGDPLRLGPYRLAGVLGAGGMGKVYFGHDSQGRAAAIKVLLPQLAHDQHLVQRFLREAEAARAVTGPGVAHVLAAQTEGGRPWIASEFLAGPTLDQAVSAHGLFSEQAVRALAASLAQALQNIHAVGLIHRDLKPENIVLTSNGPRIIDFGIARPEHGLTLTTTGQVPVTPGYGAPEQVLGQRVGPAADIFSLGAVLAYAASGRRAYDGAHVAAVQYEVVHGEPDLSQVPEQLRTLIGPCLAKDPAFRPSPDQIRTAFAPPRGAERIWQHGPLATDIKQREVGAKQLTTLPGTVVSAPPNRRRFLTGIATGAAVLAAGGGAAAWLLGDDESGDRAKKTSPQAKNGAVPAAGKRMWGPLMIADPWSPPALVIDGNVVFGGKDGGLVVHGAVDGKKKWEALNITPSSEFLALPDGLLVAADAGGTVHAFTPSTGKQQWTADVDAVVLLAANDDALFLMTRDKKIRALDTKTRKPLWTVTSPFGSGYGTAGKRHLVLHTDTGDVSALDTGSGKKLWERRGLATYTAIPAVHGDNVIVGGNSLKAVGLDDGKDVWSVPSQSGLESFGWGSASVDGRRVYAVDNTVLHCRELSNGAKLWAYDLKTFHVANTPPAVLDSVVCGITVKGKSFDAVAIHKETGKRAWGHEQHRSKSLKLTADRNQLFLLQGESATSVSGG